MKKILIVDDDDLVVRMYKKKFENEGYEVHTARDGEEGLQSVRSSVPDLMLLDVMMPRANGIEVLKKIKEDPHTRNIPVLILTNMGNSDAEVEKIIGLGASAYIVKANKKPSEIVSQVKEILRGNT